MSNKILTVPQYAKEVKKDRATIFRAARDNKLELLPGVKEIKKAGRYYLLEISRIS